ncbi:hypothetical protein ACIQU4_28135 [Streptomyces sp. NPDC090741]|uniref:hypothetical protein n=1 Tax=Streptomyces sp. NPDC090741 TaxID=3365967 RepID=UPI00381ADBD7
MSTAIAPSGLKPVPETYAASPPMVAILATFIALIAAALALVDLFANGMVPTLVHLAVGLGVFGAVRLCIGVALDPFRPTEPDHPESSP